MSQQIDSPVCLTAIVMAAKRAIENERDDRLFDDPFAVYNMIKPNLTPTVTASVRVETSSFWKIDEM
jgi:O-methyltransferase involved in polyketide biosynthesis